MDDSMYDEFGNYIGPELESDAETDSDAGSEPASPSPSDRSPSPSRTNALLDDDMDTAPSSQIVMAEDKKYYPTAEEVYGEDVETLVMDEDELPLEQAIIKPIRDIKLETKSHTAPKARIPTEFLLGLASNPALVRNVALVGQLQHGKTVFMDMLVEQTHDINTFDATSEKHVRYTDTRVDEQERRVSIKAVPMSLVLEDSAGKSYLFT